MQNKGRIWLVVLAVLAAGGVGYFLLSTRTGAEAVQAVHDTAEQATGLGAVKAGQEMKSQIRDIKGARQEQFRELEK